MKNWTIGTKIGASFLTLAILLVASIGLSIWQVHNTATITQRAINLRAPTERTSVMLLNGVNYSLAALRGWMILGNEKFKAQRQDAWKTIDTSLENMDDYSKNWTNPENVRKLQELKTLFGQFKGFQKEIEDISGTIENTPATKVLLQQAAPQANILVNNITKMINIEATLPATRQRKNMLGMMADVRGTTARGLANIRAFLLSGDPVFKERFDVMWTKNIKRFADLQRASGALNAPQKALFAEFSKASAIFAPLPAKMFAIRASKEWNLANLWLGTKAAPTAGKIFNTLEGMIANQEQLLRTDSEKADALTSQLLTIEWVLLAVGIVFSLFLGLIVTRNISKLMAALKSTIATLMVTSSQLTEASGQVAVSSQSLAEGSSEQAASLEETSSTLEEMASMTQQNADNTKQADGLAGENRRRADEGGKAMTKVSDAIVEIKESSDQTAKIIKTIDEIAFQTNLLALNAAVEAARAGDAGRGFAVVAEEVRNLAKRAADAARSTNELIEDSQQKAEAGVAVADEAQSMLGEINTATQKVGDLLKEIAAASQEQARGAEQVNAAVTQMDQVTQSNAASAEETAAASQELSSQAVQVSAALRQLQSLVGGGDGAEKLGTGSAPAMALNDRSEPATMTAKPASGGGNGGLRGRILQDEISDSGQDEGFSETDFRDA